MPTAPYATDEDVVRWLRMLPDGEAVNPSFIRQYVRWAGHGTVAPLIYHVQVALGLIAVLLHPDTGFRWHGNILPVWWGVIVGEHGTTFKSTCLDYGEEILNAVAESGVSPYLVSPEGSHEAFTDSFGYQSTQLVIHPDMGDWLETTKTGIYKPFRTKYLNAFDCKIKKRNLVRRHDEDGNEIPQAPVAEKPRMSLLAGVNPEELEASTDFHFWSSGLGSRFCWQFGVTSRKPWERPTRDDSFVPWLVNALRDIHGKPQNPATGLTDEADEMLTRFEKWCYARRTDPGISKLLSGALSRAPTMALRCAMMFAADYGEIGRYSSWRITTREMRPAIYYSQWAMKSANFLLNTSANTVYQRNRRTVLAAISSGNGLPVALSEIASAARIDMRDLNAVLTGLQAEGKVLVAVATNSDETHYSLSPNYIWARQQEAAAADSDPDAAEPGADNA